MSTTEKKPASAKDKDKAKDKPKDKEKEKQKEKERKEQEKEKKPYEEIGAIFNGNEIKIRVPKTTCKPEKLTPSQQKLQQLCTCGDDDSICSETCGLVGDGRPQNKLNFQFPDDMCEALTHRTPFNSELVYSKQEGNDTLCNVCNITPNDAPKGVHAEKVLHPDKDVFVLKIGKQTDEPNRTGNIEVELITPRIPAKPKPVLHRCANVQCEEAEMPFCMPCSPTRSGVGGGCCSCYGNVRSTAPRRRKSRRPRCCH